MSGYQVENPLSMTATVTFVGHATLLIEINGIRILTDPLLRRFIGHLRRQVPVPEPDGWQLDAVLISHLHGDHLDLQSLKLLGRDAPLIVPKGAGAYLKLKRFRNVQEIKQGEIIKIGDVDVTATRADHAGRQLPWTPVVEPLGFLLDTPDTTRADGRFQIYFAGDTDLFPEMTAIGGQLDLALLPVWGWGPTLGPGHMDPLRAAQSLTHLQPKKAIPIHWGTYCPVGVDWLRPKFLSRPPREFEHHASNLAPDVTVHILEPGQTLNMGNAQ